MGWEKLVLVAIVAAVLGLAKVAVEVWRQYRAERRSLATALAISSIVAGVPVVFIHKALEQANQDELYEAFGVVGVVLLVFGGVLGGIGLVLDRRLRARQNETNPDV